MRDQTIEETARLLGRDPSMGFNRRRSDFGNIKPEMPKPVEPVISEGLSRWVFIATGVMAAFALLLWALAHLIGGEIARGGHTDDTSVREIIMGNDVLNIPANLIRFPTQRVSGSADRVELYLHWPSLSGYQEDLKSDFNSLNEDSRIVFVSLEVRTMSHDMSGRISPIYERFFQGDAIDAGNGLMRQPLSPSGGFIDEDLYYEAQSPYPYAARCVRRSSPVGAPICIRDVHIGRNLMLAYRFHIKHLDDWMVLDTAIRDRVKGLLVR